MSDARKRLEDAAAAYTRVIQNWETRGSTEADRRFSDGEAKDTASEAMWDELSGLTFEDLRAILAEGERMREALVQIAKPCGDVNGESRDEYHQTWSSGYEQGWGDAQDLARQALGDPDQ